MAILVQPAFDVVHAAEEAAICNMALARIGAELIRDDTEQTQQARLCRTVCASVRDELLRVFPFRFSVKSANIPEDDSYILPFSDYLYAYSAESWDTFAGTAYTVAVISVISGITVDSSLLDMEVSGTLVQPGSRIIAVDSTPGFETITLDRATTGAATSFSIHIPVLASLYVNHDRSALFEVVGSGNTKRILSDEQTGTNDTSGLGFLEVAYIHAIKDPAKFDPIFRDALAARIASMVVLPLTKSVQMKQAADQEFSTLFNAAKIASSQEMQIDANDYWWSDRQAIGSDPYLDRRY